MDGEFDFEAGEILLVNKPKGWSSFDVVKRLRSIFRIKKIGHAGTLDPMASGLMIVVTGRKAKEMEKFKGLEKEYEGVMEIGARTKSFDTETEVFERRPLNGVTEEKVRGIFNEFMGVIEQTPPMYSAVKVNGRRLYKYARTGKDVDAPRRKVSISKFEPVEMHLSETDGNGPEVRFRLVCSKGTYVRSLVEDLGQRLGCGAYLKSLVRTGVGAYRLSEALTIEDYETLAAKRARESQWK
jgi:tRNA pseudouridine55 synthase